MLEIVYIAFALIVTSLIAFQLGKVIAEQTVHKITHTFQREKNALIQNQSRLEEELQSCRNTITELHEANDKNPGIQEELQKQKAEYMELQHKYIIECEERKKNERITQMEKQNHEIEISILNAKLQYLQNAKEEHQKQVEDRENQYDKEFIELCSLSKIDAIDLFQQRKDELSSRLTKQEETIPTLRQQLEQKREMAKSLDTPSLEFEIKKIENKLRMEEGMREVFIKRMHQLQGYLKALEESLL